jgi:TIR domain
MKVFISWSGDRSKQIAEVIREWLQNVLQFTRPYFTPADTEKGTRWANEISKELNQSKIGIIAMTDENLESPWITFEAGAISKVVEEEARVCPIVFGIAKTDLVGPLASFQAIEFNRAEVRQLLTTINNAAAKEVALTERGLDAAFDMWWPDLEKKVAAISSAAQLPTEPRRSERDLLEEVVSNTRSLIRELQALPPWQRFTPPTNPVFTPPTTIVESRGTATARGILYDRADGLPPYDDGR